MTNATVSEGDLFLALKLIRNLRMWAFKEGIDPWAVRQALLVTIRLDTMAALARGVSLEALRNFDRLVEENVKEIVEGWTP